jgi:CBS domain-containing protein
MKIAERFEFRAKAPVLTFTPDDMVIDAVRAMSDKNYGASIIVDPGRRPVGIVTERDFMRRLLAKDLDAHTTPIRDIMTSSLKVARAEDEIAEWLRIMTNERFRHLPVVDADGVLLNIMTQGDFISYTWPELFKEVTTKVSRSFENKYQLYLIVATILVYTSVMVVLLRR